MPLECCKIPERIKIKENVGKKEFYNTVLKKRKKEVYNIVFGKKEVNIVFGHIYCRNPSWKIHFLSSDAPLNLYDLWKIRQSMYTSNKYFKPISHTTRKTKFQKIFKI